MRSMHVLRSAFPALLAGLCALQVLALLRAPAAWMPAAIHVTPHAGETVVLGLRELAAPHADRRARRQREQAQHEQAVDWLERLPQRAPQG